VVATTLAKNTNAQSEQLYTQTFSLNIKEIVKIKENFPNLSTKKIEKVYKVINKTRKERPKINMNSKGPSQRQVLVHIN